MITLSTFSQEFRAVRSRLATASRGQADAEELARLRRQLALIRGRDRIRELPSDLTAAEREYILNALRHGRDSS